MSKLYGESGRFYREIKVIRFCKVCGAEYRYQSGKDKIQRFGLCITHRREFQREMSRRYGWRAWSPERKKEATRKNYPIWLNWVKKNLDRRRKMALESYHRRKNIPTNKKRRHRATKHEK